MSDVNAAPAPALDAPAAPPSASVVADVVVSAKQADEIAALHARFDSLEALIKGRLTVAGPVVERTETVGDISVTEKFKGPCAAFRAWEASRRATVHSVIATWDFTKWVGRIVKGVRTFLFFGISGLGALAASFQGVDISGVLSRATGAHITSEDIMVVLCVGGVLFRLITSTPAFQSWQKAAEAPAAGNDGEAPGVGSGTVDEPK